MANNLYCHYVYMFKSDDGVPYYIGMGKRDRAYRRDRHGLAVPENTKNIIYLHKKLSRDDAEKLEKSYIKLFGRKDLNTGILLNRTNGGKGSPGVIKRKKQ